MATGPLNADPSDRLVLAIVMASNAPLVLLDGALRVIAASHSFCRVFNVDPSHVADASLFDLGGGEWNRPRLRSLLNATVSGTTEVEAYEFDLVRSGQGTRGLSINARKLHYGDEKGPRVLVSIIDATDARVAERFKDDLLREQAILLQEIRHRVANSLQIIAAVLLQDARRVSSSESRAHLHDAHQRVMSVAEVQRQLEITDKERVPLKAYFTQLCASLGASMIRDHECLSMVTTVDDTVVPADVSVSLGLIVTELVINALKHAFPEGSVGKITVGYQARGPGWTLWVSDDGVGMAVGRMPAKPGLGTSIVEALAHQLRARVQVHDNQPGAKISIGHIDPVAGSDADIDPTSA